jgi:hypothetical protein
VKEKKTERIRTVPILSKLLLILSTTCDQEGTCMDQPFESDVMEDLAANSSFGDEGAFDAWDGMENEGFEGFEIEDSFGEDELGFEDTAEEGFLGEDEYGAELAEDFGDDYLVNSQFDDWDALEEAVADALDAEDSDEFFRQLLTGVSRIAGLAQRGAATAGRVARGVGRAAQTAGRVAGQARRAAGQVQRVAGQVQRVAGQAGRAANPLASILGQIAPLLQQYAAQGFDEWDALEDLADLFADEELDEALPVLAGMAARTMVRPLLSRTATSLSRPIRRQIVRSTTQVAQNLIRRQGPAAVRALPRVAQSVGQTAARRRLPPSRLPRAIQQTGARVTAQPSLVRQLSRPASGMRRTPLRPASRRGGVPQRLRLRGPVEITITRL